jgi:uncharacterized RDD family membrane protein YckC
MGAPAGAVNPTGPGGALTTGQPAAAWTPDQPAAAWDPSQPPNPWSPHPPGSWASHSAWGLPNPNQPTDAPGAAASFGQRLGAHLIDQMVILLVAWFVGRPFGAVLGGVFSASGAAGAAELMSVVGALLWAAVASFVLEVFCVGSYMQATPGKRALQLKVTNLRGRPLGYGHAFGRYVMKGVSGSLFCVGFLIQPFTSRKQALHDLLAGTLVVRADRLAG